MVALGALQGVTQIFPKDTFLAAIRTALSGKRHRRRRCSTLGVAKRGGAARCLRIGSRLRDGDEYLTFETIRVTEEE